MTRKTTQYEKRIFKYLNKLRESGQTNMFGATPYIQKAFCINRDIAKEYLLLWMKNFNKEGNYDEITIKEEATQQ